MRDRTEGNEAKALLDDELWGPLVRAIRHARKEIVLTQLLFEPAFAADGVILADELAAAADRGARVTILVNQNRAIPDSYDELVERFADTRVEVFRLPMSPNVMHAKLVLVDGEVCFLVDAPFEQKYFDDTAHPYSPREGRAKPFHAVSLRVRGPAVATLRSLAADLFGVAGAALEPPAPARRSEGGLTLGVTRTAPAGIFGAQPALEVIEDYERAIGRARRFVYLETQYFTSPRIRDALLAALDREPQLEAILVLNLHMDIPGYDAIQRARLAELAHPRVEAFALWSPRRVEGALAMRQLYVHSKVAIVDDAWATIGSANLDSISLHEADEFPVRAPPNVEVNVSIEDPAWIAALRRRLWAEHLRDEGVWRADAPADGWLAHWRRVADENERRFQEGDADEIGRVLRFGSMRAPPSPRRVGAAESAGPLS